MLIQRFTQLFACTLLLVSGTLFSQSATFSIPNISGCTGDQICLPITVTDFSDVVEFGFTLDWDENALDFQSIQNINPALTGLATVNVGPPPIPPPGTEGINTAFTAGGGLPTYWRLWDEDTQTCDDLADGLDLPDDAVLFEVCFTVLADAYGSLNPVSFFNAPQPLVVNKKLGNGNCTEDAVLGISDGSVTACVDPLILTMDVPPGNYQPGDLVCVDIFAESGFIGMQGLQFGLDWDRNILQIESVQPNTDITNNTPFIYNVDQADNCFAVSWSFTATPDGITLSDNTLFASACFRIIGDCSQQTNIEVSAACNGSQVEATNSTIQTLAVVTNPDRLRINACNDFGLDVIVDCGPTVNVGDNICVAVEAGDNYIDIQSYNYLVRFDESILRYTGVQNFATFDVTAGDFDDSNVANGIFGVDLGHFPDQTYTAGQVIYEVCFDVIGYAPNTPIIISDPSSVDEGNPNLTLIGVDPVNCEVSINQPSQVIMSFGDVEVGEGATSCLPVTVSNFENITDLNFTLQFDNDNGNSFVFSNLNNNAIPGATVTAANGILLFQYSGPPITIPDGGLLFDLCLNTATDATPNICSPVDLIPFPIATVATSQDGTIDGIVRNAGEACVLFPEGFGLIIGNSSTGINSEICIPVSVESFDNILSADFNINFDPAQLTLQGIFINLGVWQDLELGDFTVNSGLGIIEVDWTSDAGPTVIADDAVVFELCFETQGNPGCYELDGNADTSPSSTTSAGDGSIVFTDGEICVDNRIVVDTVIVIPSPCANSCDGKVVVFARTGDPENQDVFIRWQTPLGTVFQGDTLDNICPGWNYFSLFTSDGNLTLQDSVFMTFDPDNAATANAGEDQQLSCTIGGCAFLSGNGNVGDNWNIYLINEGIRLFQDSGTISNGNFNYCAENNGVYLLEVFSEEGCIALDTVEVFNPVLPVADAGPATLSLTCNNSPITLDGAGSSTDGIVTYLWERLEGPVVVDTVSNMLPVTIDSAGRYRLTVTFPQSQCTTSDIIIISDERTPPNVNLNDVYPLACDGGAATLDAGPDNPDFTFAWQLEGGGSQGNDPVLTTANLGTYFVTVTNTITGCETIDTAMVVASQGNPVISDVMDQPLNCNSDTIQLMPMFANVSGNQTYSWTSVDGGFVIGQQSQENPLVIGLGTYTVTVDDGGCTSTASIQVVEPVLPVANAGMDMNLLCGQSITIDASGSQSDNASYLWFTAGDTINGEITNMLTVDMPGLYAVEVRDLSTQCRSTDTVEILPPVGFPMATLPDTIMGLNCANGSIVVNPQVDAGGDPFTLQINGPGNPVVGTDPSTVEVFEPGNYTLTVTNNNNGCAAEFNFAVDGALIELPFVATTVPVLTLTCLEPVATISGVLSSSGPNFEYVWNNIVDGETPNEQGNDTLMVSTAGTYTLTVINTETQCSASDTVIVQDGRMFPQVQEVPFEPITCDDQSRTLSIQVDDTDGLFIQWFGPPMGNPQTTLIDTNVLSIDITGPGGYTAVIIDQASSCITQIDYPVELDLGGIDSIMFAPVDSFDCASTTVTIDASASLDDPSGVQISWESLDGNTITPANGSLIVSVDGPGSYVLNLATDNGCTNSDTIVVESANDTPFADAGDDVEVECGEMPMLDGTNSSINDNDIFNYVWTAISGGSVVSGSDGLSPIVSGPGTYVLTVTSLINLCEDTDTVIVNLLGQEPAALPFDFSTCSDSSIVEANLPAGTTGAWEIINQGGADVSLVDNMATITGLVNPVTLAWTLSAPGCDAYSSDTITISQATAPIAMNDDFVILGNNGVGTINLLDNDQPNGTVTVTLLDSVPFGEIVSFFNGELTYDAGQGVSGSFMLNYEICNEECGTCDQAVINVRIDADGQMPPVYNTITPNGDGLNEFFVFDLLAFSPEDYPDNSIIIFNRWGDVLYEAAPYNNDWDGRNQGGEPLPEGTYYYILRLSLGEGDIIRGDVTILR